jgi:hypothetical protein
MELSPGDKFQIIVLIQIVVTNRTQIPDVNFILEQSWDLESSKFETE